MNSRNKPGITKKRAANQRAAPPAKLRIIGGDMRGRSITYHGADFTRPMKDNIRENLFNILGRACQGAIALDMFGGTGALAFESLSRGATRAVTIEQSRHANRYIRQTAEQLGVEDRMKILSGDAFQLGTQLLLPPADDTPWIVFLCPPYVLWEESLADLNRLIALTLENAPPGSVLVAETEKRFESHHLPPGQWDFRVYGGTKLAFIEPAMRCGLEC